MSGPRRSRAGASSGSGRVTPHFLAARWSGGRSSACVLFVDAHSRLETGTLRACRGAPAAGRLPPWSSCPRTRAALSCRLPGRASSGCWQKATLRTRSGRGSSRRAECAASLFPTARAGTRCIASMPIFPHRLCGESSRLRAACLFHGGTMHFCQPERPRLSWP